MRGKQFSEILSGLAEALSIPGARVEAVGLVPSCEALVLARLSLKIDGPLLIITRDEKSAEELHQHLQFFWPVERGRGLYLYPRLKSDFLAGEARQQRIEALEGLRRVEEGPVALVASLEAVSQEVPPVEVFYGSVLEISRSQTLDRDELSRRLTESGYRRVDMVEEGGDYGVRGGIVDVFSPLNENPLRIEFFGDQVESIREFNPADQLSIKKVERARILPLVEPVPTERGSESVTPKPFGGAIFEYLGARGVVVLDEADLVKEKLETPGQEDDEKKERTEGLVSASSAGPPCRIDPALLAEALEKNPVLELSTLPLSREGNNGAFTLTTNTVTSFKGRFHAFIEQLKEWMVRGSSVLLVSHNEYQARRLKALLEDYDLGARIYGDLLELTGEGAGDGFHALPSLSICVGSLPSGFEFPAVGMVVITEAEVFGAAKKVREKGKPKPGKFFSDFRDLKVGDYVVHLDYGIGQYLGISHINVTERNAEFLKIRYAGGEALYVPVESLNLVQKYLGSGDVRPQLDRLGGTAWKRKKASVKESIRRLAEELLELYAARQAAEGHPFSPDGHWHQEFDSAFEYEETPDQLKAIEEVKADMERPGPMDRLICGDVGYGKTEVAMRASFKAVMDSKQVAVLVPTTILAQQHFNTFSRRFEPYPVRVEMLSRFKTPGEQKAVIEGLARGSVDIVIGTHRLLQKDIVFKDLGLVVVDEEQRFGVRHKERLKKLRKSVDVLTITATPIPRTLHLSLMGVRDLSIIDTPPEDRLSIETHLVRFSDDIIRKAILKEIERGGQVYFVHNRVENIEAMRKYLRKVVPEGRVGVAHGQLPERALEKKMLSFLKREFDILLATSIIESGLDIPSVNTIIINRADRFGLAQLYQLRGRVGRDRYKAYAYLLIPGRDTVTDVARKRLKAIQEFTELGSGFRLAARDMEIRGAGNILGAEQSGHIAAVGFDLYCRLIEETVHEIKGEEYEEEVETEVDLGIQGFIPQDYVTDTNLRLMIYKKLSSLKEVESLQSYARDLEDRYGKLPPPVERLIEYFEIKIMARALKLERLKMEEGACLMTFHPSTPLDPGAVIELVKRKGEGAGFVSENSVQIKLHDGGWENAFMDLKKVLQDFISHDNLNRNGL
jgi:transcription-repair coupling factor (superfamily II helicase)